MIGRLNPSSNSAGGATSRDFEETRLQSTLEMPNVAQVPTKSGAHRKTLFIAVSAVVVVALVGVAASVKLSRKAQLSEAAKKDTGPRPMAALGEMKKEFSSGAPPFPVTATASAATSAAGPGTSSGPGARDATPQPAYAVPKVEPDLAGTAQDRPIPLAGQPIGAQAYGGGRSQQANGATSSVAGVRATSADDASMMLASTRQAAKAYEGAGPLQGTESGGAGAGEGDEVAQARQRLRNYQQQLGTLVTNLSKVATHQGGASASPESDGNGSSARLGASGSLGNLSPVGYVPPGAKGVAPVSGSGTMERGSERVLGLEKSSTPMVRATRLPDRSLLMPKGTAFTCSLKTRVISATSGMVSCITARNVYSDDGRVLLVERGSHMDGEYRITSIKPGATRIPVLWTRIRTPNGIVIDLDSPGTGALGEGGIDGEVDNRWTERIGGALLLSFIDDLVRIQVAEAQSGSTVYGGTMKEGSKMAEKVLESTINIPPLIYQNQGSTVGVYVARDVDFSAVYELRAGEVRTDTGVDMRNRQHGAN